MSFRFHVVEDVLNLSIRADYECRTPDPLDDPPVHILVLDHPESLADLLVGVGEQRVGQVVFILKLLLLFRRVG